MVPPRGTGQQVDLGVQGGDELDVVQVATNEQVFEMVANGREKFDGGVGQFLAQEGVVVGHGGFLRGREREECPIWVL